MRASASCSAPRLALASAVLAVAAAASALAAASASALLRFIQKVMMATSEPLAAMSAPQVRTSCIASPLEDARDLLDRAAAEVCGHDDTRPRGNVAGDRICGPEA